MESVTRTSTVNNGELTKNSTFASLLSVIATPDLAKQFLTITTALHLLATRSAHQKINVQVLPADMMLPTTLFAKFTDATVMMATNVLLILVMLPLDVSTNLTTLFLDALLTPPLQFARLNLIVMLGHKNSNSLENAKKLIATQPPIIVRESTSTVLNVTLFWMFAKNNVLLLMHVNLLTVLLMLIPISLLVLELQSFVMTTTTVQFMV
jgi:hypothetical protein